MAGKLILLFVFVFVVWAHEVRTEDELSFLCLFSWVCFLISLYAVIRFELWHIELFLNQKIVFSIIKWSYRSISGKNIEVEGKKGGIFPCIVYATSTTFKWRFVEYWIDVYVLWNYYPFLTLSQCLTFDILHT